jgi:hypothetical protein
MRRMSDFQNLYPACHRAYSTRFLLPPCSVVHKDIFQNCLTRLYVLRGHQDRELSSKQLVPNCHGLSQTSGRLGFGVVSAFSSCAARSPVQTESPEILHRQSRQRGTLLNEVVCLPD